jgi:DNA topoisomerase-1
VETDKEAKAAVLEAVAFVAKRLGNTPAVCRKSYILPAIIDEFLANGALENLAGEAKIIAFIERIGSRDERKHLTSLLKKSIRAKKAA